MPLPQVQLTRLGFDKRQVVKHAASSSMALSMASTKAPMHRRTVQVDKHS